MKVYFDQYGYWLVFFGSLFENTFLLGAIFPGGTIVLLGAFYSNNGTLSFPIVFFLGWIGKVLGISFDYWLGRNGRFLIINRLGIGRRFNLEENLIHAERLLRKHGGPAILLSHFLGQVRSFVAITAGLSHFSFWRFLLYQVIASLIWNIIYITGGYALGSNRQLFEQFLDRFGYVLLFIFLLWLAYKWARKRWFPPKGKRVSES